MVTGSRKQFMQMEQVSSLWKACSVSESMFLKIKEEIKEGKRKSFSSALIRKNKSFGQSPVLNSNFPIYLPLQNKPRNGDYIHLGFELLYKR